MKHTFLQPIVIFSYTADVSFSAYDLSRDTKDIEWEIPLAVISWYKKMSLWSSREI